MYIYANTCWKHWSLNGKRQPFYMVIQSPFTRWLLTMIMCGYWAGVYQRSIHKPYRWCVYFFPFVRSVGRNGMRFCEKPVHTIFHSDWNPDILWWPCPEPAYGKTVSRVNRKVVSMFREQQKQQQQHGQQKNLAKAECSASSGKLIGYSSANGLGLVITRQTLQNVFK